MGSETAASPAPAKRPGAPVLIADGDAKHLYARFGFKPVMPASIGMARVTGRTN